MCVFMFSCVCVWLQGWGCCTVEHSYFMSAFLLRSECLPSHTPLRFFHTHKYLLSVSVFLPLWPHSDSTVYDGKAQLSRS